MARSEKRLKRSMEAAALPSIDGLYLTESKERRIRIQHSIGVWSQDKKKFAYFCTITIYRPGPSIDGSGWVVHQHSKACTVPQGAIRNWKKLPRVKPRAWVIRYREKPEDGTFWYSHNPYTTGHDFKHLVNVPNHAVEFRTKARARAELNKILRNRMGFAHDAKKQLAVFRRGRRKSG